MMMTKHAKTRCQQRGIKPHLLELVIEYGRKSILPGGATGYILRRRDKNRLIQKYKKMIQTLDHLGGVKVVEGPDGMIITTYHRR